MRFSGVSAIAIWNAATRSLTNTGPSLASSGVVVTTIAASGNVDLRPSAGHVGLTTVGAQTGAGATGSTTISVYDGTVAIQAAATAAAASSPAAFHFVNTPLTGILLHNNDATVAARYITNAILWTL